jgi:CRISPR-associated protein Cas2
MFILITYDVNITSPAGQKRLRQVAKACLDYGKRVQNSVFECVLTEAQFVLLKDRLSEIINLSDDSIIFYKLGNNWKRHVERIGKDNSVDVTDTLIL